MPNGYDSANSIQFTVGIPTLHREPYVCRALEDLAKQTVKNFEIVIVDQSDEASERIQETLKNLGLPGRYYHVSDFRGLPQARNFAMQFANTDQVIFIDDDVEIDPSFVEAYANALNSDPGLGVIAGRIIEKKDPDAKDGPVGVFNPWTGYGTRNFHSTKPQDVNHAPGGNFLVTRAAFNGAGGFDEAFAKGAALFEETDFCIRVRNAGYRLVFEPKALLHHIAAPAGGCREPDWTRYITSMARNRSAVIQRHTKGFQKLTAYAYLMRHVLGYVRSQKRPFLIMDAFSAMPEGLLVAQKNPLMTNYRAQNYEPLTEVSTN